MKSRYFCKKKEKDISLGKVFKYCLINKCPYLLIKMKDKLRTFMYTRRTR